MALDHDQARRHAQGWADAFNRRDLDAVEAMQHQEMTHHSAGTSGQLGQQQGRVHGRQAHREFLRRVWAMEHRFVLEEVFTGPHGYAFCAFLGRHEHDGMRVVVAREVDADGLIRNQWAYIAQPPEG